MATIYNPQIVTSGLMLCLDAANVKSYPGTGTTWTDLSGNGNNGTLVNGPTFSSTNLGSIVYDGVNDHSTNNPPLAASTQKYTLSAWWITSVTNRIQSVYEQNTTALTTNRRSSILIVNSNWGFNGQGNDAHDKVPVRVNQWTNGVITIDITLGTNPIKIYENGILYWQGDSSGTASNLNIGNDLAGTSRKFSQNSEYFFGNISQIHVYNRVLSADEIQQNFNALRGRYGL